MKTKIIEIYGKFIDIVGGILMIPVTILVILECGKDRKLSVIDCLKLNFNKHDCDFDTDIVKSNCGKVMVQKCKNRLCDIVKIVDYLDVKDYED